MPAEPTIFIVDDDEAVRDALSLLMRAEGLRVESFPNALRFLEADCLDRPGCLLLDVRMPGMGGLELQEHLRERGVTLPIIILTGHGDIPMAIRAMRAGALDFIEKPFDGPALLERIGEALEWDAQTRRLRAQRESITARMALLSPREREVLDEVAKGKYNKVIAADLGIGISTVEAHRKKIMEKLQAKTLPEVIRMLMVLNGD